MKRKENNINHVHPISDKTRTAVLRECWNVIFDVDGNAPSDALVISCSNEALAREITEMLEESRDGVQFCLVKYGKRYFTPPIYSVDGYNWATCFSYKKGEREDCYIISSLSDLADQEFFQELEDTDLPDGIYDEED